MGCYGDTFYAIIMLTDDVSCGMYAGLKISFRLLIEAVSQGSFRDYRGVYMKVIKSIFYVLVGLLMAVCVGVLVCALNPSLTQVLAKRVQALQQNAAGGSFASDPGRGQGTLPEAVPGINVDWMGDRETRGYLVPSVMPQNLPEEVNGLWGYEPVSADTQQIVREEAENLGDILAGGVLDVEFMHPESFYPYYLMLEPELKQLYKQIYANALSMVTSFAPVVNVNLNELTTVFEAVLNDHPELVLVETGYSCMYLEDGTCVEITLEYNELINDVSSREEYVAKAIALVEEAGTLGNDLEKEKFIHDKLAEMVVYDTNAPVNQVAYSAIENGRTVCAGYARAFQLLMQELGIPCFYCTGYAGEAHAWNIVLLDGKYYNVDVTWDDTDPLTYDYFNKTDAEFSDTHIRTGLSVYLPACMGEANSGGTADAPEPQPEDGTGEPSADEEGEEPDSEETPDEDYLINPNPQQPLGWVSRGKGNGKNDEEAIKQANLDKAKIQEEDVLDTMDEYYADCAKQLKEAGVGDKHFSNVIPASLWSSVERAYSSGSYRSGYVDGVLKELKAEDFAIQLQVQDLGGGYYRLYHNIYTE